MLTVKNKHCKRYIPSYRVVNLYIGMKSFVGNKKKLCDVAFREEGKYDACFNPLEIEFGFCYSRKDFFSMFCHLPAV